MKEEYKSPEIEIVLFEEMDIITGSLDGTPGEDEGILDPDPDRFVH